MEGRTSWKHQHGRPAGARAADVAADPELRADIQRAADIEALYG